MGGVGEVFVVDWACSIGQASGRGEIRYWSSNCIGAGDTGTWGIGAGDIGTWGWKLWLRHGHLLPFS